MHWTNSNWSVRLIVVWSVLVHVPGLLSPLRDHHAYRQCQTASMAVNYAKHGMHFWMPEVDTEGPPVRAGTEFPIYSYLLAALFKVFGVHDILGRFLSMVFAAWGAAYLYLFARPRVGETIAQWSALIVSSIPVHIFFTRTVQPEPMALWALLGFLYIADKWHSPKGGLAQWVTALVLGALAPLLKLPYLYLVLPAWFLLGYERQQWKGVTRPAWLLLGVGFVLLPLTWYQYAQSAEATIMPLGLQEQWKNLAPIFTFRLWRAQFISRIPELVLTYSGIVLAGFGVYNLRKAKSFFFLMGMTIACGGYVVLLGEYGLIHRYTLLPLAPIAAIWIASGVSMLWGFALHRFWQRGVAVLLVLGIPVHAGLRIKHWYNIEYDYLQRASETLEQYSQPEDLVLVAIHEKPVPLYYFKRYGYAVQPKTWRPEEVDALIRKGVRFVFIPKEDNAIRLAEWNAYLSKRAELLEDDEDYRIYRIVGSMPLLRHG